MTRANASLSPEGRRRLVSLVVDEGWSMRRVVELLGCLSATVKRWVGRCRAGAPLTDRTFRPRHCPHRLPQRVERRIIA